MRKFEVCFFPPFADFFQPGEPKHAIKYRNAEGCIEFIQLRQLRRFCDNKNNHKFPYQMQQS